MSSQNEPLAIYIMIYAEASLSPHEIHVALLVNLPGARKHYIFHAVEDISTETEMMFEKLEKALDPLGTKTAHERIALSTAIPESQFESISNTLAATPVPRPKPANWNCQSWLREGLVNMERSQFLPPGDAARLYQQMMDIINATALDVTV